MGLVYLLILYRNCLGNPVKSEYLLHYCLDVVLSLPHNYPLKLSSIHLFPSNNNRLPSFSLSSVLFALLCKKGS